MLYSEKQGTGKSTLAEVLIELFGRLNTGRVNGVNKLIGRFNKEVLENKLVIVEEVEVKRGSPQANAIKSLVTEDSIMVEAKLMPVYVQQIHCAFLMTTNHLPLWLEESDRRFFILNFDHHGYANGGKDYNRFTKLVGALKLQIKNPEGVKGIYDQLMRRDVPQDFGLKVDITKHRTDIMERLQDLAPDAAKQVLEETLKDKNIVFVPMKLAHQLINKITPREINAQTHIFSELGWRKGKFAWDGGPQNRAWYLVLDEDKLPNRGKVYTRNMTSPKCDFGWSTMASQVDAVRTILRLEEKNKSEEFLRVSEE